MTKRTKWIASFILVVLLACFIGCSDSKTGPGSGGGVIDPPNLDKVEYNVLIVYDDWAEEWDIYVYGDLEEEESTVTLIIDNKPIHIDLYSYVCYNCDLFHTEGSFFGMNFVVGQTYKLELITQQGRYNANLRIVHKPHFVETPWIFTPNDPFTVKWQLQRNSDLQEFILAARDNQYYYDWYSYVVFLSSNVRSHTVPRYSLPPDCYYEMQLTTINYVIDKKAMFASLDYIWREFRNSLDDSPRTKRNIREHGILKRLFSEKECP